MADKNALEEWMKKSTAKSGVPMRVERRFLNDIAAHVSGALQESLENMKDVS